MIVFHSLARFLPHFLLSNFPTVLISF
jgi:hypothetical protein